MKLLQELLVIYDDEGCEGKIGDLFTEVNLFLTQCMEEVRTVSLEDWKYDGSGMNSPVLYIASLETDEFHSKIKPSFLSGASRGSRSLLVMVSSDETELLLKKLKQSVKTAVKKKVHKDERKKKTREMLDNIVEVRDILVTSLWWPHVLKFVQSLQSDSESRESVSREIGIYFKIDAENSKQFEWYEQQRNILDTLFKVKCRSSGDDFDEDIYIKSAKVVVMYVDRASYQDLNGQEQQKEGKRKMLDSVNQVRKMCASNATKFHLFMNEAGVKFNNIINNETKLKMVGHGMAFHLVEILSLLDKISVKKREEHMFYSRYRDRVEREVFNPDEYPGLLPRNTKTPREGFRRDASMGDILFSSHGLQDVCFQPFTTKVTVDDDPSRVTCVSWLSQRFRR